LPNIETGSMTMCQPLGYFKQERRSGGVVIRAGMNLSNLLSCGKGTRSFTMSEVVEMRADNDCLWTGDRTDLQTSDDVDPSRPESFKVDVP
jgi:hypothetical protein